METPEEKEASRAISVEELERRQDEFDVPEGAIAAFRAGAAPVIVFLRSTGEEYMLASPEDTCPPGTDRRL
ncbi:MAG: hypothetical protein ACLGIN_01915 [Candidatus Sericytochromatia bacterium]